MAWSDTYTVDQWADMARQCHFSASALAKQVGMCERQFQRYTKIHFGRSPQKWLDEQRLIFAAELIRHGNKFGSIKRISFEMGFKQPSHFSRSFKQYHGISPMKFLSHQDRV